MVAGIGVTSACGSDDESSPTDAGRDAASGSGGRGGSAGKGGAGGGTGAVGAGGSSGAADSGSCELSVGLSCDGAEDCPAGQRCCGKWDNEYMEFGCFASCLAQQGDAQPGPGGGPLWLELCHAGDTCEDSTTECLTSDYLPSSLSRCFDQGMPPDPNLGRAAGQLNCGTDVCGSGEKCCLREPLDTPYCAPTSATCECNPSDADAGPADGAPSTDGPPADASSDVSADADPDVAPNG